MSQDKGRCWRKIAKNLGYSVSATTRQPRAGEVDGVNYYFHTKEEFEKMIANDELLEWAEVYGNYYGTPLQKIQEKLAAGEDILLEIDTQGAMKVKAKVPEGLFIYLIPPSLAELEKRIRGRGSETEESLARRLGAAREEIEIGKQYGYVVVNDEVENAVATIESIRIAEQRLCKLAGRQPPC